MLDIYEGVEQDLFAKTSAIAEVGDEKVEVFVYTRGSQLTEVIEDQEWSYEDFVANHQDNYCANVEKWDKRSYEK